MPKLTTRLLWAALASLLLSALPAQWLGQAMLWPVNFAGADAGAILGGFRPWQPLTHVLVNFGLLEFVFIGLTLYYFGAMLESAWGQRRFALFLIACLAGATLLQWLASSVAWSLGLVGATPAGGATGVMYGILAACAFLWPNHRVMLLLPPVPMSLRTMVIAFAAINLWFGFWQEGLLAQFDMLGGVAAAWLHIRYWRGQPPFGPRKPPPRKLRIVH